MGETFISGLGTVRECRHCGALVAGGPTACTHCTKTWVRLGNAVNDKIARAFWSFYWRPRGRSSLFRRIVDAVATQLPGEESKG